MTTDKSTNVYSRTLSDRLERRLIHDSGSYKDNQYLYYKDCIVVLEAQLDCCLHRAHLS